MGAREGVSWKSASGGHVASSAIGRLLERWFVRAPYHRFGTTALLARSCAPPGASTLSRQAALTKRLSHTKAKGSSP